MAKKVVLLFAVFLVGLYVMFGGKEQQTVSRVQSPPVRISPPERAKIIEPGGLLQKIGSWPLIGSRDIAPLLDNNLSRKNFVLIFDGSGSMSEIRCSGTRTKAEAAKEAVSEWASSVPEDANLGLVAFDQSGLSVRLPLGINNRGQFRQQIQAIVPNYKTPLSASVEMAYKMLTEQGQRQLGYGEYIIVVVTDGVANDPLVLERSVNNIIAQSPVMIHTIGFCINTTHSLNQMGRTIYKAANDPAALRKGLQDVLAESESFDISAFK